MHVQDESSQPMSNKRAISYELGLRLKRICSEQKDHERHRRELNIKLRKRAYSEQFSESQLRLVYVLERQELLKYKGRNKNKQDRVPLGIYICGTITRNGTDI